MSRGFCKIFKKKYIFLRNFCKKILSLWIIIGFLRGLSLLCQILKNTRLFTIAVYFACILRAFSFGNLCNQQKR